MEYNSQVFKTVKSKAENIALIPITSGRYLICTDTSDVYYDTRDNVRKHLTDIIDLETDVERAAILVPLDKFYFVRDTAHFWRYLNDVWADLISGGGANDAVYATLIADGWMNGKQSISINGLGVDQSGIISITQDISTQAMEAIKNGELYVCAQVDGITTIAVDGTVPTCDISTVIILLS